MPRRDIPFIPDQYYHIYNRGNNRQAVFLERENYLYFLKGIKRFLSLEVDILVYCLMPTHYHILWRVKGQQISQTSEVLKTSEVSQRVSRAMQKLLISYTKAVNKRYDRVGALFQGQFQSKPIKVYNHLLHLCAYIHVNPIKDRLVTMPEDWEFSNYREWIGQREGKLVCREFIKEHFGSSEEYSQFVQNYIAIRNLPNDLRTYLQELER